MGNREDVSGLGGLYRPALCLAVAAVLLAFSNGRWILPAAAWLGPLFMLRFVETTRPLPGLALALTTSFLLWSFSWQAMIPAPGLLYFMVTAIYAVVYFLPYVAHRFLAARSSAFASSLVFPTAWVSVDLLFQRFVSPYGSWTSLAYSQLDATPLTQLASLTGTFGIVFLMTWFAATVAWLWRCGFGLRPLRLAALAYGIPLLLAIAFGAVRLQSIQPQGDPLRVAAIMPSPELETAFFKALLQYQSPGRADDAALEAMTEAAQRVIDDLQARTRRAVDEGARLIAWSETAARLTPDRVPALLEEGRRLVDAHGIVLILGFGSWDPAASPPLTNELAIIRPDDPVVTRFHKARPIVGSEASVVDKGNPEVAIVDLADFRLAAAICHDFDFPDLILGAGRGAAELMVAPSADWPEIAGMHARMARLRAVENGATLMRPTAGGLTIAVDPAGREASWTDAGGVLFTELVPARVPTVYAVVGDLFAWLCVAAFLGLAGWFMFGAGRQPDPAAVASVKVDRSSVDGVGGR